jgi:hypothetical protein
MTIVVASFDHAAERIEFISDSRVSGQAATESGAKLFRLPVEVVTAAGRGRFPVRQKTAFGFGFSGSTLAALNAHAYASACLQNLVVERGAPQVALADVAQFLARVARVHIADVVSRSQDGIRRPQRFLFNALVGGFCTATASFELYQVEPVLIGDQFDVKSVRMDLQPGKFFPIGSATGAFVELCDQMDRDGLQRGAYGAMELLLALEQREDVGGWIQYGEAVRGDFKLRPTMRPNLEDPAGPVGISFMGFDSDKFGDVGPCKIGYRVMGPAPPVNWLAETLRRLRA